MACKSLGFTQKTNQDRVSDNVLLNKVSSAALDLPAIHGSSLGEAFGTSSFSRSCSVTAPSLRSVAIHLAIHFRRVDGVQKVVSLFLGCARVAMTLPEKQPLMKGSIN